MNTINKTSVDLLKERLNQLKKLFPDLFTDEGNLNEDELRNLLSRFASSQTERYEFRWAGKTHSKKLAFTPSKATLVPDEKRSVDFDKTENVIIEGDNLEVLKLLQKPYHNQIKCIYIDPPYNTGNDFIYNDDFSESKKAYWEKGSVTKDGVRLDTNSEAVGRYHSNWLDMMQSRLLLARNLLKEDGVIFVSIDDHEVANLRKLMDEVFGEENFVECIIWKKKYGGGAKEKYLVSVHEYVLVYAKTKIDLPEILVEFEEEKARRFYKYKDDKFETLGYYRTHPLEAVKSFDIRENLRFSVIAPDGKEVYPKRQWRWSKERFQKALSKDEVIFSKSKDGEWVLYSKQYLNEENGEQRKTKAQSVIDDVFTQEGTKETINTFGDAQIFSFPKPVRLIQKLFEIGGLSSGDIVLDFFAGSGTTGQAVMELNRQDDGNRKFILVQLPEATDAKSEAYKAGYKTISDICIERVKRAGEKFKVFKLTYSHFPENLFSPDPNKSEDENIQAFNKYLEKLNQQALFDFDFDKLLYEIALKDGFNLNFKTEVLHDFKDNKIVRIKDEIKEALVCLDQSLSDKTFNLLKAYKDQRFICLKRVVDTTKKWNLQQLFDRNLWIA